MRRVDSCAQNSRITVIYLTLWSNSTTNVLFRLDLSISHGFQVKETLLCRGRLIKRVMHESSLVSSPSLRSIMYLLLATTSFALFARRRLPAKLSAGVRRYCLSWRLLLELEWMSLISWVGGSMCCICTWILDFFAGGRRPLDSHIGHSRVAGYLDGWPWDDLEIL